MLLGKSIERLISIKNPGIVINLCLLPLAAISWLFRIVIQTRTLFYRTGVFKSLRLPCRVIVVGNITTGGTGKTPMVVYLADQLVKKGYRVAVLTRGYGGKKTSDAVVVSDGINTLETPESVGDEAFLLASKLKNVPIVCSRDRVRGGSKAFNTFKPDIIILDDGFQHMRLQRDLDIVLVNSTDPFGNGFMLPRGKLREPASSLKRAGIVVLTKANLSLEKPEVLKQKITGFCSRSEVFVSYLIPSGLTDAKTGEKITFDEIKGKKTVALCSVGDPESFFSVIEKINVNIVEKVAYPDHHFYKTNDYADIYNRAKKTDFILTTEKDIAKIDVNVLDSRVIVLETEVMIERQEDFFALVDEGLFGSQKNNYLKD